MSTTMMILFVILLAIISSPWIGEIHHTELHHTDLMAGDE
jgi:hypothetical protein